MFRTSRSFLRLVSHRPCRVSALASILLLAAPSLAGATHAEIVLDETVEMVCFPPPAMIAPPCPVPTGVDPDQIAPNPDGVMRIQVDENGDTRVAIRLTGMSPNQTATAVFVHYPPNQPPPHPIFAPPEPGLGPIARINTPVANTAAGFTEGLGREPHQIRIFGNGVGWLWSYLDYNPLAPEQVPLVNGLALVDQALAPIGSPAEQPPCCPDFPAGPQFEPVGASYLRVFDPDTGFQVKDADGRPELVRSPIRPAAIAVLIHTDGITSGLVTGVPIAPFLQNPPATTGSVYLLGLFPLGDLGTN